MSSVSPYTLIPSPICLDSGERLYAFKLREISIERTKAILTHIAGDDYHITLATILDLSRQTLEARPTVGTAHTTAERLLHLRDDLLYIQKHFTILKR